MTDNRIIQMQFENREFEKNIAKSQKSVEDLKKAMDFDETSEGLKKFSRGMRALDFSVLGSNIQRLTDKFTGLGNAGEYVLSRLRASIEGAASSMERFIRSISLDQVSVGQSKYDSLNKSVQTIIAGGKYTEKEAYGVMERVMAYTDQTSHNFQTMVGQIAALQSVGMELGEAERFLEGIGNASTKAGAGATEAAAAMSLMAKVVGGTHLGKQQFDSLNQTYRVITEEWRKMALEAAAEVGTLELKNGVYKTAKQFGKQVEVSASTLETTLAKGWFTGDVAKKLYAKYQFGKDIDELQHPDKVTDELQQFGKTAYLTGQRALTFADAMNAVRESVSSGWMDTFRIALGDVTEAAEFFTNVCDRMIESLEPIKDFRNDVLRSWRASGGHDSLMDILLGDYWRDAESGAVDFMDLLDGLGKTIYSGFVDFIMTVSGGDEVVKSLAEENDMGFFQAWVGYQLSNLTKSAEQFLQKIKTFFTEEINVGGKATSRLELIHDIVHGIAGALALGLMVVDGILVLLGKIREALGPSFDAILLFFSDLGRAIFNTAEQTQRSKQIKKFFMEFGKTLEPITNGINDIVIPLTDLLRTLLGLDKEGANGVSTLQKIGEVIKAVVDIVSKAIGPILSFIGDVITLLDQLASGKLDFGGFLQGVGDAFSEMFSTYKSYLPDWLKSLFGDAGDEAEKQEDNFFTRLVNYFKTNFATAGKALETVFGGFSLKSALESGFGFVSAFNFLGNIIGWFKGTNLYNVILAFLGVASLGALFSLLMQARKAVKTIGGFFDDVGGNLKAGIIGQYEWNSEKVLNFAKGILMIAASIMLLGSMDPKALIAGVVAVGLIFAALMIFVGMVNSDKFKANYVQQFAATAVIDAIAVAIVGIVAALSVLMLAMAPMAAMSWQSIAATIIGFVAVVATLGAFIVIMLKQMNKFMKEAFYGNGWGEIGKLAVMMLLLTVTVSAISLSVAALMVAMAPLAAMGWQKIIPATVAVVAIMAALGTFVMVMLNQMNQFMRNSFYNNGWGEIGKMAAMMILLAATVAILASGISVLIVAMAPLAAMSWQSILAASAGVGIVLAVIGTFIMVMLNQMDNFVSAIGGGGTSWGGIAKMAAMMLVLSLMVSLLSVGISAIIVAITPLAAMSAAGVAKAVIGLGVILFELGAFMKKLLSMADASGATVKLMGFTAFAFSIGVLVLALTPLAMMDWAGWGRAMLGLAIVLGALIGAMKLMQVAQVSPVALASFAGFAASIGILIFALQPLAGMDWAGWGRAMIGLGLVLLELIGAMKLMEMADVNTGSLFGFIGFALSMAILIYALKPLAEMDTDGYYRAIFGLGTVMLEVVALTAIMNELKPNLAAAGTTLLMLVGLGAAMILFGIAFNEVKDVPVENILAFAGGISALMLAIAGAAALMKIGGIAGLGLAIAGIVAVLGVIALMAPLVIKAVSGGLRDAAGDLAIMADLMGTFTSRMSGVDEGGFDKAERIVEKMWNLIGKMMGITFTAGTTREFMNAMSRLTLAADEMIKFSNRVSSISGDGGIRRAVTLIDGYKDIFENHITGFDAYIGNTQGFYSVLFNLGSAFDYFDNMTGSLGDPEENSGLGLIKQLAACAPDLKTIYNMDLDRFKRQLAELGGAMIIYARGAASVNANGETITADTDIGGAIILLQKISESLSQAGGFSIPENMPSDQELTNFGVQLAALAGALVAFEEAGSGLGDGTEQALKTLEFFRDLKNELNLMNLGPDLASAIQGFKDENGEFINKDELTIFGEDIAKLGSSMAHFAASTQVLDEETGKMTPIDYSLATAALESIGKVAKELPETGGWVEIVKGKKKGLDDLATEINLLGSAMGEFHTSTSTFDEESKKAVPMDFTNAIAFLNSIGNVQEKLPRVASFSVAELFLGHQQTLGDLGSEIAKLGSGINVFSEKVTGKNEDGSAKFDPDAAKSATELVESMIPIMQRIGTALPKVGGVEGIFNTLIHGSDSSIGEVGRKIGELGEGLGTFGGAVSGKFGNPEEVLSALGVVETVVSVFSKLAMLEGMYTEYGSIVSWIGKLNLFLTELTNNLSGQDAGANGLSVLKNIVHVMEYISQAISSSEGINVDSLGIFSSFSQALTNLSGINMEQITASFTQVGANISAGVKIGIESGTSGVIQAAVDMAVASYEAAKKALDEHSPSRVFEGIGNYVGLGMAQGIRGSTASVVDSATGMSKNAIATAGTLMAKISQVMAEGTDSNPTITPVLDLSQVEAGMSEIRGKELTLDTRYSAGYAASSVSGRQDREPVARAEVELSGIYSRMDTLGQQILDLGKSIRSMRLVLNTGVVAGGLTDNLDQNLGRKVLYAERGN